MILYEEGHQNLSEDFDCWDSKLELNDEGFLDFDLNPTEWSAWTDPLLQNNGGLDSSSTSIEEDLMYVLDNNNESQESSFHLQHGINNVIQSLSGEGDEVFNNNSSPENNGVCLEGDELIPCRNDSAEYKGLRLVHLLTTCAEAMSDGANDLVEMVLSRLGELVSPWGSTMERVAYYLFQSLLHRHHCVQSVDLSYSSKGTNTTKDPNFLPALSLLNQVFPYIRIAHFTANQSILEAIKGNKQIVHIVDFDIMEGMQWPALMESLKSQNYKIGHLKITALKWDSCDDDDPLSGYCVNTGKRLSEYANSLGIPFSFEETEIENLKRELRFCKEEIVVVNCMWELPHMRERNKKKLGDFLHGVRHLNPAILNVGTGPRGIEVDDKLNFMERFTQCFRILCAVFDSLEAGLPEPYDLARAMVERLFMGPAMCRALTCMAPHEEGEFTRLVDIPLRCGFCPRTISQENIMHAEYMVAGSDIGRCFRIELAKKHELILKWNSSALTCVSTWNTI